MKIRMVYKCKNCGAVVHDDSQYVDTDESFGTIVRRSLMLGHGQFTTHDCDDKTIGFCYFLRAENLT